MDSEELDAVTEISIHASEKEATGKWKPRKEEEKYFNPRLREGGDLQMN